MIASVCVLPSSCPHLHRKTLSEEPPHGEAGNRSDHLRNNGRQLLALHSSRRIECAWVAQAPVPVHNRQGVASETEILFQPHALFSSCVASSWVNNSPGIRRPASVSIPTTSVSSNRNIEKPHSTHEIGRPAVPIERFLASLTPHYSLSLRLLSVACLSFIVRVSSNQGNQLIHPHNALRATSQSPWKPQHRSRRPRTPPPPTHAMPPVPLTSTSPPHVSMWAAGSPS